ncbi:gp156 [Bacillus phage W.Ph.]|uniref:Gp156 n=1 Tax=Bacillus phage W.Ph. TaxID=764595 RepID=G9B1Q7_9CAUD|nr:gp156 [Bacillus phage W.Ph.]ADH03302.1 gp156 [Bacillus phage W.Ph.]
MNLRNKFVDVTLKSTVIITTLVVGIYAFSNKGEAEPTLVAHNSGEYNTETNHEKIQKAEKLIAEVNNTKVFEDALNADRQPESKKYNTEWIVPDENTVQLSINFRAVERIDGVPAIIHKEYAAAVAKDVSYVLDEMNDRFHGGKAQTHEITLQILNETGDVMAEMGNGVK